MRNNYGADVTLEFTCVEVVGVKTAWGLAQDPAEVRWVRERVRARARRLLLVSGVKT